MCDNQQREIITVTNYRKLVDFIKLYCRVILIEEGSVDLLMSPQFLHSVADN